MGYGVCFLSVHIFCLGMSVAAGKGWVCALKLAWLIIWDGSGFSDILLSDLGW